MRVGSNKADDREAPTGASRVLPSRMLGFISAGIVVLGTLVGCGGGGNDPGSSPTVAIPSVTTPAAVDAGNETAQGTEPGKTGTGKSSSTKTSNRPGQAGGKQGGTDASGQAVGKGSGAKNSSGPPDAQRQKSSPQSGGGGQGGRTDAQARAGM